MEEGGQSSDEVDKSRVLDVKPLRCFPPVFPKSPVSLGSDGQQQQHPAEGASGGVSPSGFYPFGSVDDSTLKSVPAPIRSYRSAEAALAGAFQVQGASDGGVGGLGESDWFNDELVKRQRTDMSLEKFDSFKREHGDAETVEYVMKMFNAVRRRLSQLEEANELVTSLKNRPDSNADSILRSKGVRTNTCKRIGNVPGVEVGDIFSFRNEMCLVGLHLQTMGGIDYLKESSDDEPLALSIVSSGAYDDNAVDKDVLIYTGQGGVSKKQVVDQKLEKGNLALERSMQRGNEIRVIRGFKDPMNSLVKIYMYDGLYTVREFWTEKGKTGGNIFKFKLVRLPNQRSAFSVWKSVEKWKQYPGSRAGLILSDLSSGAETRPVSLVNEVDNNKGPSDFTYCPSLKYLKPYTSTKLSLGCDCHTCTPGDLDCACIRKNDGDFPYLGSGILVSRRPMLYECGPSCPCFSNCKNRVSQTGLKFHFEVFKTIDKGWGLRSWNPIRAGEFICVYAGEVVNELSFRKNIKDNDYLFDTSQHKHDSLKWNYDPSLLDDVHSAESTENYEIPIPLTISAKKIGNVARFMNHSCNPNVFWQPVMYEVNEEALLNIAFFAIRNIPPMTELTFDYGIASSQEVSNSTMVGGRKKCLCKSASCRGYFG